MINKYLLIREWGCGFYADFLHVTQGLYLAELLGRQPLVHWGKESLYNNTSHQDVFKDFFDYEALGLSEFMPNHKDTFPSEYKISPEQILLKNKYDTSEKTQLNYLQNLLTSNCELVVYDRFLNLGKLLPLLGIDASNFSYKNLVSKYHKPCYTLLENYDREMKSLNLSPGCYNSIQLRLSEKVRTQDNYDSVLNQYYDFFNEKAGCSNMDLFICSEDQKAIDFFSEKYPGRVVSSSASRNVYKFDKESSKLGITDNQFVPEFLLKTPGMEKKWLGMEVITDVMIASKSNLFIGSDSNVAKVISFLLDDSASTHVFTASEVISADKMK